MSPIEYLDLYKVVYKTKNNGTHLIVEGRRGYIDYWPSTGKWQDRNGTGGFGVMVLVEHIQGASAVSVELSLLPNEADWLRAVMQNPLSDPEVQLDHDMREALFIKLTHVLKA